LSRFSNSVYLLVYDLKLDLANQYVILIGVFLKLKLNACWRRIEEA